jgi:hypothetical protein
VRLSCTYPDDLKAFRVAIDGPADLADGAASAAPGLSVETLAAPFADRDAPVRLASAELVGREVPKDLYYTFDATAGDGEVDLDVTANGSTVSVELFDENGAPIGFEEDASTVLSVSSTGVEASASKHVLFDRPHRVLLRLSSTYPASLTAYHLALYGAAAPGAR